ncbi:MAG: hypothetical protein ACM65L_13830 [Microcoleus sp.]
MGGIGKTALASKLRNMIKDQFECLIWIDLSHAHTVWRKKSSLLVFKICTQIFSKIGIQNC